jgi:serpin B
MRHLRLSPLLFALAAAACNSTDGRVAVTLDQASVARDPAPSIGTAAVAAAVSANNAFAFDLYGQLRGSQPTPGNLLTSPISASLALTMAYAGAQGQTATEMATALHLGSSPSSIFDGQNGLSQALASRAAHALTEAEGLAGEGAPTPSADDYQIQIVNSVWGEQSYPWTQPFLTTLARSYGTGVYLEDFVHQWDPARQTINTWVSQATANKIEDLLPAGALDDTTRMVLVNAIHLKLPWLNPFQTAATDSGTFTRTDGTAVQASFMNQTQDLFYIDDGKAQIVSLPLMGGDISVVLALPHGDLATYEADLTATSPDVFASPTSSTSVALSLPKVDFTSPTFSLAQPLQAMGMVQAFEPASANLKGMCATTPDGDNIFVSDVLQKATLVMQEGGVEAAAATAVIVSGSSSVPPPPVPLVLDRPFVMAIVDGPTGAILFLGHVEDPTDAGAQ